MIWLLDTNIIAYALKRTGGVRERVNEAALRGDQVVTSVVTFAELLYGAERSARREENRREILTGIARIRIISFGPSMAERYASIKAALARRGKLKDRRDLMIAATAVDIGATLVTHDGDFSDLAADLTVRDWYASPL